MTQISANSRRLHLQHGSAFELYRVFISFCFVFIRWIRGQNPFPDLVDFSGR